MWQEVYKTINFSKQKFFTSSSIFDKPQQQSPKSPILKKDPVRQKILTNP